MKLAANKVLEAFPGSFSTTANAVFTGNPLRQNFSLDVKRTVWTTNSGRNLRILVLGGSQGAKILNDIVPETLASLNDLDIRHQTGVVMQAEVAQRYLSLNIQADVFAFIEDIEKAYRWADLIICRAGAMTVSEVSACGLPAIFIPLLHAIDDHQTANAKYLADAGAAIVLPQPDLTPSNLRKALLHTMTVLPNMSRAAKAMAKLNATNCVADICIEEAAA
jgi:UDP-N-acetylglucosamine--N-acetylmuramyl-(pentapeptide) pyrophosphoryl-undecaprenol N-acetylglucosamine transferase